MNANAFYVTKNYLSLTYASPTWHQHSIWNNIDIVAFRSVSTESNSISWKEFIKMKHFVEISWLKAKNSCKYLICRVSFFSLVNWLSSSFMVKPIPFTVWMIHRQTVTNIDPMKLQCKSNWINSTWIELKRRSTHQNICFWWMNIKNEWRESYNFHLLHACNLYLQWAE